MTQFLFEFFRARHFDAVVMRLCNINPKYECHRQVFCESSQKGQPTKSNHCLALLLHNTTMVSQKNDGNDEKYGYDGNYGNYGNGGNDGIDGNAGCIRLYR